MFQFSQPRHIAKALALAFSTRSRLRRSPNGIYTFAPPKVITPGLQIVTTPKVLNPTNYPPIDWNQRGAVTGIKDQGKFNACFDFSGMVPLEAIAFQLSGKLQSFSEQYVLENCPWTTRWEYGYPQWVYKVAMSKGGLPLMRDCPYTLPRFHFNRHAPIVPLPITGWRWLDNPNNIYQILGVLAHHPLVVSFRAFEELYGYKGDSINEDSILDNFTYHRKLTARHSVAIVGHGWNTYLKHYLLAKNSWGISHGLRGNLKIASNHKIFESAIYPTTVKTDPMIGTRSRWRPFHTYTAGGLYGKDYNTATAAKQLTYMPYTGERYQAKSSRKAQCPVVERLTDLLMVGDISVQKASKCRTYMPHTAGMYQAKWFRKAQCPVVDILTDSLMMHVGKKLMTDRIIKHTMENIQLLTDQNPIQVIIDAVINSGPREDATRIGSAGVVSRQAVYISPLRRVNLAIYLITTCARESAFRNSKTIAECLADELINAAKGYSNRYAIKNMDGIERVAKANR